MKKLFCLVMCVMLFLSGSSLAEIDLSAMSTEELFQLSAQINAELQARVRGTAPAEALSESVVPKKTLNIIANSVKTKLASEEFAKWQQLYKDFTGSNPGESQVSAAVFYENEHFDVGRVVGFLIEISADVGHWVDEAAEQGIVEGQVYLFFDALTMRVYDSITTDAANSQMDTTTPEGRATYLMWVYGNVRNGSYSGNYFNDQEKVTELSQADLDVINNQLA